MTPFKLRVLAVVKGIPPGETLTYKEVASRADSPGAARAVGQILRENQNPLVPCHRVIASDGSLGGFAWGLILKLEMLTFEKRTKRPYTDFW